jgi:hypothetical protein
MRLFTIMLWAALAAMPAMAAEQFRPVALLPFDLDDTSGEGPRADQDRRLRMLDAELRQALAQSNRFTPLEATLPPGSPPLRGCNRCDIAAAERVGAGLVLTGEVMKVSTLILSMRLILREVPSGVTLASWHADFRGNTDESWQRALRWLIRNRVLAEPQH